MICARCVYDSRIPYIRFDQEGICNYCRQHDELDAAHPTGDAGWQILTRMAAAIKRAGRGKKFDVIVGVSGGCDSSYLLYLTKKLGLRPLAAHFDNTWNSRIAVENIETVLKKLEVPLYTYVVDNSEFSDLMRAFFRASVPELDTPSDIGLATTLYLAARKYGVRYVFDGHSFRTEGITPPGWFYIDGKYVESVHEQYGEQPIKTFPNLELSRWLRWVVVNRIRRLRPLYWIDYRKVEIKKLLTEELNWTWYGGHHMENRSSYFTNNYYLPRKFGIDLRYSEFSALIRSGQMEREDALRQLSVPKPIEPELIQEFKQRLALTEAEFERVMNLPHKSYRDYPTYKEYFERYRWFFHILAKCELIPQSFYLKYTKRYD